MVDFKALLAKSRELRAAKCAAKKPSTKPFSSDALLHGTGFTKKLAEQADKKYFKLQTKSQLLAAAEKQTESVPDQPDVIPLQSAYKDLPSTMMDDTIQLDPSQQAAVDGMKTQKYSCLIGAAGSGKTTTVKCIIASIEDSIPAVDMNANLVKAQEQDKPNYKIGICFCSFMGRAVQQLKRAIPEKYHSACQTIHTTLGYMPVTEDYFDATEKLWKERRVFRPTFTAENKLNYKIVIVDEAGSVPIFLWDQLFAALPDDCRVILIGDINQLPPVQGHSVLAFAMSQWPTFVLNKIHRQKGKENPIIENAHRVLNGQLPINDSKHFIIKTIDDGSIGALNTSLAVIKHLHKIGKFDAIDDAFIVPQNIGILGQEHLNENLVRYFNPTRKVNGIPINPRTIITAGYQHVVYATGDKVMISKNDRKAGLTNGMIGVVPDIALNPNFVGKLAGNAGDSNQVFTGSLDLTDIGDFDLSDVNADVPEKESERQASHIMTVKFQNINQPIEFLTAGAYQTLAHSYAFTCHKAQGGEYPTVVILVHSANLRMLTREWLYTAITRAQEKVILLCNRRGLIHAVNNQMIKGKTIEEKAKKFIALAASETAQKPNLPTPETVANTPYKRIAK